MKALIPLKERFKISHLSNFVFGIFLFTFITSGWVQEQFNLSLTRIASASFILVFLINLRIILNYSKKLLNENFYSLDFLICLSFGLHCLLQIEINFHGLSCISLYLFFRASSYENKQYKSLISLIFIVSLISLAGVYLGLIEFLLASNSELFFKSKDINYPGGYLSVLPFHSSGFQFSYNSTAYLIICSLGFAKFLDLERRKLNFIMVLSIIGLVLCQAKIGLLFIAVLVLLKISKEFSNIQRIFLVGLICTGYLFFAHIVFVDQNQILTSDKYFRVLIYNFQGFNFYLSLFSWLKLEFLNYLYEESLLGLTTMGYRVFSEGYEPHFLYASLVLLGGLMFSILLSFRIIMNVYSALNFSINNDIYYFTLVAAFFTESFLWDSYDSPIFWAVIVSIPFYKRLLNSSEEIKQ
jgi:hypothetical protein